MSFEGERAEKGQVAVSFGEEKAELKAYGPCRSERKERDLALAGHVVRIGKRRAEGQPTMSIEGEAES
jgi:hypothetical protein